MTNLSVRIPPESLSEVPGISKWNRILSLDFKPYDTLLSLDYYKRTFFVYRETGIRLSEGFDARIEGDWLIIKAMFYE